MAITNHDTQQEKRPMISNGETRPVAPLKIISLDSYESLANKVNTLIVNARHAQACKHKDSLAYLGYEANTYLVDAACPRFSSGEAKAIIRESIHGTDLYILTDVLNYSKTYSLSGSENMMSPDDQFQDLKRIIDACNGKAHRINVIIPFLYESRQHYRSDLESLDCATALQELADMGVINIITFDANDPRVQNAIPLIGFDNFYTSYQFIQALLTTNSDLKIDNEHLMVISPDEGGMTRAVYYANIFGVDVGMFYKRRDYSVLIDGMHPIVEYEFLGSNLEGKTVLIVEDIIDTGMQILELASELKSRKAAKIYILATFGLFTLGYDKFDECYQSGIIDHIYTTNLSYCPPELLEKPYYTNVDISRYLALIIDTLNHDKSIDSLIKSSARIQELFTEYREKNN